MAAAKGNQYAKGRRKASPEFISWRDCLHRAIAQDKAGRMRKAAEALLDLAAAGDLGALHHIADRIDGKALQSVQVAVSADLDLNITTAEDLKAKIRGQT